MADRPPIAVGTTQPFRGVLVCPACGHDTYTTAYCEMMHLRGLADWSDGTPWIDTTEPISQPVAHLHRTCANCRFEWLERPMWDKENRS